MALADIKAVRIMPISKVKEITTISSSTLSSSSPPLSSHQENSRSTCLTLRHLEESASVMQGPLVASVINLRQVQKQLASPYLLHLHEMFKVFRVFKVVKVFKVATLGHSIIIILVGCGQRACSNYRWLALGEHNGANPSCIIM